MSEPTDSPLPETERPPITRRQLVGASGFAAVGLALSACGEGSGEEGPEEDPLQAASAAVIAPSGWINVRDFGALGNGVADDTAAIQAACDALMVASNGVFGGTVYLPRGTYLLSRGLILGSGTNLLGDSPFGTCLRTAPGFSGSSMIRLGNSDSTNPAYRNVFFNKVSNLRIDQLNAQLSRAVIYSNSMNELTGIHNVFIDRVGANSGVLFESSPYTTGPAVAELNNVSMFGKPGLASINGVHSRVGGMILRISHFQVASGAEASFERGVFMEADVLHADSLHFEGCKFGVVLGARSLGGKISTVTGHSSGGPLVAISSTFKSGCVIAQGLYLHSLLGPPNPTLLVNASDGTQLSGKHLLSYTFSAG